MTSDPTKGPDAGEPVSPFAAFLRPTPPPEVRRAFALWVASLVVGYGIGFVVGLVVGFTSARRDAQTGGTADNVDAGAAASFLVGALIGLAIVVALQVFFLLKMRRGRNWARIVLTAVAVLNAFGLVQGFLNGQGFAVATGLISLALVAAATTLMYRPAANAYFRAPNYS